MKPIVISAIAEQGLLGHAQARVAELEARGFEGHACIGTVALQQMLRDTYAVHASPSMFVLLDSSLRDNCANAQLVTTLFPECGMISLLDDLNDESLITALQSGADVCCARQASVALLATILYSLLRRRGLASSSVVPEPTSARGSRDFWRLTRQAWVLEGPQDCSLSLTTAERAFLLHLTNQSDLRASHEALMLAVDPDGGILPLRTAQARLGVLVSRLRRKLQLRSGLELPIKSLHRWGYMFTDEIKR